MNSRLQLIIVSTTLCLVVGCRSGGETSVTRPTYTPKLSRQARDMPTALPTYTCTDLERDLLIKLSVPWSMQRDSWEVWVKQQIQFAEYAVKRDSRGEAELLNWQTANQFYGVEFGPAGARSVNLVWTWQKTESTVAHVLSCLGPPSFYEAYNGPAVEDMEPYFALTLWYPDRGLVVSHASAPARRTGEVTLDLPLSLRGADICPAGPMEQVIRDCYSYIIKQPADYDRYRSRIRPWPGSLERITVDNEPLAP